MKERENTNLRSNLVTLTSLTMKLVVLFLLLIVQMASSFRMASRTNKFSSHLSMSSLDLDKIIPVTIKATKHDIYTGRDPSRVKIFDTTLRDGEQAPGCTMNGEEKMAVAKQLAKLGVDVIEAGFPIASEGILNMNIL